MLNDWVHDTMKILTNFVSLHIPIFDYFPEEGIVLPPSFPLPQCVSDLPRKGLFLRKVFRGDPLQGRNPSGRRHSFGRVAAAEAAVVVVEKTGLVVTFCRVIPVSIFVVMRRFSVPAVVVLRRFSCLTSPSATLFFASHRNHRGRGRRRHHDGCWAHAGT